MLRVDSDEIGATTYFRIPVPPNDTIQVVLSNGSPTQPARLYLSNILSADATLYFTSFTFGIAIAENIFLNLKRASKIGDAVYIYPRIGLAGFTSITPDVFIITPEQDGILFEQQWTSKLTTGIFKRRRLF